jgi:hypothetical protein
MMEKNPKKRKNRKNVSVIIINDLRGLRKLKPRRAGLERIEGGHDHSTISG